MNSTFIIDKTLLVTYRQANINFYKFLKKLYKIIGFYERSLIFVQKNMIFF